MTEKEWLGDDNILGQDIWRRKYQFNGETFDQWLDRVSNGDQELRDLIAEKKFLFGGRILANRGTQGERKVTFSNCYVLKLADSVEDIYECCKELARTYSYGGGCGVDISPLRPRGAKVNNSANETTGAVSFMPTFDKVTETISQLGRRGALMISIDVRHPDIEEFIDIKTDLKQVNFANISVRVNNGFMNAVKNKEDYYLVWPCDYRLTDEMKEQTAEYGKLYHFVDGNQNIYTKKVKANDLFDKLAKNNWDYAEPGILYWDTIERNNLMSGNEAFKYAGVNPCAM